MIRSLTPSALAPPFARYAHGAASGTAEVLLTSGRLALHADGSVPDGAEAQARICFDNVDAIPAEAGAGREDVLRINDYVTDRAHMSAYMAARDAWLDRVTTRPASTRMIVSGFTRPEFVVEIEVPAALKG